MCITAIIVDFTLEILLFYDLRVQQRSALGRAGESLSRNGGISIHGSADGPSARPRPARVPSTDTARYPSQQAHMY